MTTRVEGFICEEGHDEGITLEEHYLITKSGVEV